MNELSTFEVALMPHLCQRGPNGIWLISRGVEHPVRKQVKDIAVFALVDEDNKPIIYHYIDRYGDGIRAVDFFLTEAAATAKTREEIETFGESGKVRKISGDELLIQLALIDVLQLDDEAFPLTFSGLRLFNDERIADTETVLRALAGISEP
ncbi:hypothetical protein [Andreprevotia chitinilytica]|uniref:hypothetical protein n=1 Tax=Andreprevotia chitinilytica TaxID=396808 RepID=UPI0012EC8C81|nr:hypothetical protein [Andreprevotia chitinilytica]